MEIRSILWRVEIEDCIGFKVRFLNEELGPWRLRKQLLEFLMLIGKLILASRDFGVKTPDTERVEDFEIRNC